MLDEVQGGCSENKYTDEEKEKRAAEHFIKGVLDRGEAAKSQNGKLPPGATHEIMETKEGELPKIRRRRFSLV